MRRDQSQLSRRERQIVDVLYRLGDATAQDVLDALPDPPSYSAVRALLRILEEKGHVKHRRDGQRYVYTPTVPRERARISALRRLVGTFFDGSAGAAAAALLDLSRDDLSEEELAQLQQMVDRARKEGR
jgi:predicted transcriptional regulator